MKQILGDKAQYVKTDNIQSHLNVDIKPYKKKEEISDGMVIGTPFGFKHEIKVTFDSSTGFQGLPKEWEETLKSQISKIEVLDNPDIVMKAMRFVMNGPEQQKREKTGKLSDFLIKDDPTTIFGKLQKNR